LLDKQRSANPIFAIMVQQANLKPEANTMIQQMIRSVTVLR
jgi:hypothetical protein